MIVIDTHIWVWHVHGSKQLTNAQKAILASHEEDVIGVCTISCWEIAKLVELGRLEFPISLDEWMEASLSYPGVHLLQLTPRNAIESTRLPQEFPRDPADQIITATARVHEVPLVTSDQKITAYPHVETIG